MASIITMRKARLGLMACLILLGSLGCGCRDDRRSIEQEMIAARKRFVGFWMATVQGRDTVLILSSHGQARHDFALARQCGLGAWTLRSPEEIVVVLTVPCGKAHGWKMIGREHRFRIRKDGTMDEPANAGHELERIWVRVDSADPDHTRFTYRE